MTVPTDANRNTLREAGLKLIEVGQDLVDGRIDKVIGAIGADRTYPAWEELIQAKRDIEYAIQQRDGAIELQKILVEVIGSILSSVFRFRLPR